MQLRATGRTADRKKVATLMWVSKEIVQIKNDIATLTLADQIKEQVLRSMRDIAPDVALDSMRVADVLEVTNTVTEEDLASGDFEGFEAGDTWTDHIVLASYPVANV